MFGLFKKNSRPVSTSEYPKADAPVVSEIQLGKQYRFQYEDFVLAVSGDLYLPLENAGGKVLSLKFSGASFKYGSPNDEARGGGHPLAQYGGLLYGVYEVANSPWIAEQMRANRIHPKHSDSMFSSSRHWIVCLKDVTIDVICRSLEEVELSEKDILAMVQKQLRDLPED